MADVLAFVTTNQIKNPFLYLFMSQLFDAIQHEHNAFLQESRAIVAVLYNQVIPKHLPFAVNSPLEYNILLFTIQYMSLIGRNICRYCMIVFKNEKQTVFSFVNNLIHSLYFSFYITSDVPAKFSAVFFLNEQLSITKITCFIITCNNDVIYCWGTCNS